MNLLCAVWLALEVNLITYDLRLQWSCRIGILFEDMTFSGHVSLNIC
jgi:hypothetical protein